MVSSATIHDSIRPMSDVLFGRNGGPCFVKISEGRAHTRSFSASLKDLQSRSEGLKYEAESIQNFVSTC